MELINKLKLVINELIIVPYIVYIVINIILNVSKILFKKVFVFFLPPEDDNVLSSRENLYH